MVFAVPHAEIGKKSQAGATAFFRVKLDGHEIG